MTAERGISQGIREVACGTAGRATKSTISIVHTGSVELL